MKAGTVFFTSYGEYSDYSVGSHWKALKSFSFDKEVDKWLAKTPKNDWTGKHGPQAFAQSLEQAGLVEHFDAQEVHLGYGYSDIRGYEKLNDAEDDV